MEGTFKWFSAETGYGLISPDGGGRNLFVRRTGAADVSELESLEKDDEVTYEATQGRNGLWATNVSRKRGYSWRDDSLERHEGKEARREYYEGL